MGIDATDFSSAAAVSAPPSPARAVRLLVLDRAASAPIVTATARLVSAVFCAAPELGTGRGALVIVVVGGAVGDDGVQEVLSTVSPLALRDPRTEKTCLARLKLLCSAEVQNTGGSGMKDDAAGYAESLLDRVFSFAKGTYGAAPVHLYIASVTVAAVSNASDVPLNAFPPVSVCRTMHLFGGESARDVTTLFGEVFASLLSSQVTLRVGKKLLQLVARPRIRGVGFLPAVLSLFAYRRVGIQSLPEDVLFGIPTALIPDEDAEQDAASSGDAEAYANVAAELYKRREALVAVERNGPHLVLLPAAPDMILLREVASKETLLPTPLRSRSSPSVASHSAVELCIAGAAAWNIKNDIIDDIVLSSFNPLDLDGGSYKCRSSTRAVEFRL
jgi:hypothetical protein